MRAVWHIISKDLYNKNELMDMPIIPKKSYLKRFDTFCVQNYPELTTVTYEMAAKWSRSQTGAKEMPIIIAVCR